MCSAGDIDSPSALPATGKAEEEVEAYAGGILKILGLVQLTSKPQRDSGENELQSLTPGSIGTQHGPEGVHIS